MKKKRSRRAKHIHPLGSVSTLPKRKRSSSNGFRREVEMSEKFVEADDKTADASVRNTDKRP